MVMEMALYQLKKNERDRFICPRCQEELHFVRGGAVQIVDGKADMSAVYPKYVCDHCHSYFQELLGSGFYGEHDLPAGEVTGRIRNTGDLQPVQLRRDSNGQCVCPRCGSLMDYVEGQPVRLVEGKPDMENVQDHFHCAYCHSTFRRIASTGYFQWSEK